MWLTAQLFIWLLGVYGEREREEAGGVALRVSQPPRVGRIHVSAGLDGELEDLEFTVYTTT